MADSAKKYILVLALTAFVIAGIATAQAARPVVSMQKTQSVIDVKNTEVSIEDLKANIPATYEEAEKVLSEKTVTDITPMPIVRRYLLYTNDGKNIMWGTYGRGHFIGEDNNNKKAWGIYYNGIFAGFYDGEFFSGKYRNGFWKAEGLFGLDSSYGKYVLFPAIRNLQAQAIEA